MPKSKDEKKSKTKANKTSTKKETGDDTKIKKMVREKEEDKKSKACENPPKNRKSIESKMEKKEKQLDVANGKTKDEVKNEKRKTLGPKIPEKPNPVAIEKKRVSLMDGKRESRNHLEPAQIPQPNMPRQSMNKPRKSQRISEADWKRLSCTFRKDPNGSAFDVHHIPRGEYLKSTNSSTISSSLSNGKLECMVVSNELEWMVRFEDNSLKLLKVEDKIFVTKDTIPFNYSKSAPVIIQFIKNRAKSDILFVLTAEDRVILFELVDETLTETHDEMINKPKNTNMLRRPISSYEDITGILAFTNNKESLNFLEFDENGTAIITSIEQKARNYINILLINTSRDSFIKVVIQVRTIFNGSAVVVTQKSFYDIKKKKTGEFQECQNVRCLGTLIGGQLPYGGYYTVASSMITFQNKENASVPTVSYLLNDAKFASITVLSPTKLLILTKDHTLIMCQLVFESDVSPKVKTIHVEKVECSDTITNILMIHEFQLMAVMSNGTIQYGKLKRIRPSINYRLIIGDKVEDNPEVSSPPLIFNGIRPTAQPKKSEVEEGDELQKERFKVVGRLGSGAFGQVFNILDKQTEEMVVLKVQESEAHRIEISNEINFLQELKKAGITVGFPRLIDSFTHFNHWTCIVLSKEGMSLDSLLNAKEENRKFNETNCKVLCHKIFKLIGIIGSLGYLHRDIHKGNILVKKEENKLVVSIIDFGRTQKISEAKGDKSTIYDDYVASHDIVQICSDKYHNWLREIYKKIKESRAQNLNPLTDILKILEDEKIGDFEFSENADGFNLL